MMKKVYMICFGAIVMLCSNTVYGADTDCLHAEDVSVQTSRSVSPVVYVSHDVVDSQNAADDAMMDQMELGMATDACDAVIVDSGDEWRGHMHGVPIRIFDVSRDSVCYVMHSPLCQSFIVQFIANVAGALVVYEMYSIMHH